MTTTDHSTTDHSTHDGAPHDHAPTDHATDAPHAAPAVPAVIPADALRLPSGRTLRFEGAQHGSGVSFFLVHNSPGQGPALHRHPYTETWVVLDGEATIRIGEHEVVARTGDTAVVPPGTWHRFTATGDGDLRMICIHASPVMIQELEPSQA